MPTISTGGADFSGIGDFFANAMLQKKRIQMDEERWRAVQARAEQQFTLEKAAEDRAKANQAWLESERTRQRSMQDEARQARQQAAGLFAGQIEQPQMEWTDPLGPDTAVVSQRNAAKAASYAATQSAVKALAAVDPDAAAKFLSYREKEMRQQAVQDSLTGLGKTMGEGATEGAYFPKGMNGEPIQDPTYVEGVKERLQRLQAASQLEPDQAIEEARRIAVEDQAARDEIKQRSTLNLAKGRKALRAREMLAQAVQSGVPENRIDRAEAVLVGLEGSDYDKDLKAFSEEFDQALRGLVTVSVGGAKVPVDEQWLRKYQETQMREQEAQAAEAQARADLLRRTDPNAPRQSTSSTDPTLIRQRLTNVAVAELTAGGGDVTPEAIRQRVDELMQEAVGAPDTERAKKSAQLKAIADITTHAKAEKWDKRRLSTELRKAGIDPNARQ